MCYPNDNKQVGSAGEVADTFEDQNLHLRASWSGQGEGLPPVTDPQALTGDFLDIVVYIAGRFAQVGGWLRQGDVITSGSIIQPRNHGTMSARGCNLPLVKWSS